MSSIMDKESLRVAMLARRRALEQADKQHIERGMHALAMRDADVLAAQVISLYVSMPHEWDTGALISFALSQGKTVCVPRCMAGGVMHMHQIDAPEQAQEKSPFGVWEPAASRRIVAPQDIDCIIVPALACDRQGYRLGYGRGYYDRYLTQTRARTLALCAEQDVLARLPIASFDVPCHKVITEAQVLETYEK